jgi:hypothetical protein
MEASKILTKEQVLQAFASIDHLLEPEIPQEDSEEDFYIRISSLE